MGDTPLAVPVAAIPISRSTWRQSSFLFTKQQANLIEIHQCEMPYCISIGLSRGVAILLEEKGTVYVCSTRRASY